MTMSNNLNINQQQQTPVEGDLDLQIALSLTLTGILSANQGSALVAGSAVKYDTAITTGKVPQFIAAADTDVAFGYIKRTVQSATFNAGDKIEVVGAFGPCIWLTAIGSIAGGAAVEDTATPGSVQTHASNKIRGIAIDPAADGQLLRVMITDPLATAS
jgi:hypothetical protein